MRGDTNCSITSTAWPPAFIYDQLEEAINLCACEQSAAIMEFDGRRESAREIVELFEFEEFVEALRPPPKPDAK